jgi:hypothetical protein
MVWIFNRIPDFDAVVKGGATKMVHEIMAR